MALSDRTLAQIEHGFDRLEKPTLGQLRAMVSELRAARTELRTMREFVDNVIRAHSDLGDALQKAGEVR